MRLSFRTKTTLGIAIIEVFFLSLLIFNSTQILKQSHFNELNRRSQWLADSLAYASTNALLAYDLATLNSIALNTLNKNKILKIEIRSNSEVLVSTQKQNFSTFNLSDYLYVESNIEVANKQYGLVSLWLTTDYIKQLVSDATHKSIRIAFIEVLMVALSSVLLGRYLTNKLTWLQKDIQKVRLGNFTEDDSNAIKIPNDELGDTLRSFQELKIELNTIQISQEKLIKQVTALSLKNKKKEHWIKAVINQLNEGIIAFDRQGNIHYANCPAEKLLGYDSQSIIGLTVFDLPFSNIQLKRITAFINSEKDELLQENILRHSDELLYRVDGTSFKSSAFITYTNINNHDYFIMTLADKNWYEKVENQMEVNNAIYLGILESSLSAIVAIDENGIILEVNPRCETLFGYKRNDFINKPLSDVLTSKGFQHANSNIIYNFVLNNKQTDTLKRMEITTVDGNFTEFPIELIVNTIKVKNRIIHTVIITDISERIYSTKKIQKAHDQANQANIEKTRFLSSMSHEIRTPLNIILGMINLLQGTKLNEQQNGFLINAENAGQNLLEMINDILDFSKIESGKMSFNATIFDPKEVFEDTVLLFKQRCWMKKIRLYLFFDCNLPKLVETDVSCFRQILTNFISNAVNYTDQGHICVYLNYRRHKNQDTLVLSVHDTGPGLSQEEQTIIFEEFSQLKQSNPKKSKGTGLGLAICQKLAKLVKGKIKLKTTLGKGSQFSLHLPISIAKYLNSNEQTPDNNVSIFLLSHDHLWIDQYKNNLIPIAKSHKIDNRKMTLDSVNNQVILMDYDTLTYDEIVNFINKNPSSSTIHFLLLIESQKAPPYELISQINILYHPLKYSRIHDSIMSLVTQSFDNNLHYDTTNINIDSESNQINTQFKENKILIVEDSDVNQEIAIYYLSDLGSQLHTANNGQEAIDFLKNNKVDLILMDLRMPVLGGVEATKIIRQDNLANNAPIIGLTAHAMLDIRNECLNVGMQDFLTKPYTKHNLLSMATQWLIRDNNTMITQKKSIPADKQSSFDTSDEWLDSDNSSLPLFEKRYIDKLIIDTNESAACHMLNIFEKECNKRSNLIREASDNKTLSDIKISAHALKSSSKTFGAIRLSNLAKQIEHYCELEKEQEVYERVPALIELIKITQTTLKNELKSLWP